MGDDSKIEWTDATWNPTRGCSRISTGCERCYAERQAIRQVGSGYAGLVTVGKHGPRWTGEVRLVPEQLDLPLRWRRPRRVFVDSMSDLFHEKLTDEQIAVVFAVMAIADVHTYQVLTKRSARAKELLTRADWRALVERAVAALAMTGKLGEKWKRGTLPTLPSLPLPNVWLGVSVENQDAADERIPDLLATPASVRFLSVEPLLGRVDLRSLKVSPTCDGCGEQPLADALTATERCACCVEQSSEPIAWGALHQVIVGAESGPSARSFDGFEDAVRALRDQCVDEEVAFFYKQRLDERGKKVSLPILDGRQWAEFPRVDGGAR